MINLESDILFVEMNPIFISTNNIVNCVVWFSLNGKFASSYEDDLSTKLQIFYGLEDL